MNYSSFFTAVTRNPAPYAYQERLAALACESRLISIPTGLGKTAAVILSWLWNRVAHPDAAHRDTWPRRLVYCLPMRTLVEQTEREAHKWLSELGWLWEDGKSASRRGKVGLHLLMGGDESPGSVKEWDLYPEENAILIGTQDMLLSRALNRGYGMSRYRWPMHFGLLNNDCLWVLDETQLMGVGVETSAQLDGFRHVAQWLRQTPCPTWWMSATLEDTRFATVDHPAPENGWPRLTLGAEDRAAVSHRLDAVKRLQKAPLTLTKQTSLADLARFVLENHVSGQLTLVIVNRVSRAQELYQALKKAGRKENLALVHSRFRAPDRQSHQDLLINGAGDRIVIATQAVEAGVDVSARVLLTELAPWSSLVQRFGRCNRGGEFNETGADIHWIDLDFDKESDVAPYTLTELQDARTMLATLDGQSVSPNALSTIQVTPLPVIRPVIRRKDLIDLFDTTPDIAGHDLDISRYIREGEDTDVQVFWRDLSATDGTPAKKLKEPARQELCRVAVWRFQAFLKKLSHQKDDRAAWVWDGLRAEWKKETKARAGAVYLLDRRSGGYDTDLGWTGEPASLKKEAEWTTELPLTGDESSDALTQDPLTRIGQALTLMAHTGHVVDHLTRLLTSLNLPDPHRTSLLTAARWHDAGKAHEDFQTMLRAAAGDTAPGDFLAKSGQTGGSLPAERKHFRHELASALAWLTSNGHTPDASLIAYLIAAHHGKVRLSIRSMPEETGDPQNPSRLFARGVFDGDTLPEIPGLTTGETTLHLSLMQMGEGPLGPSWLARMIALRDELGPFALAYLETLLRAADMRASGAEAEAAKASPLATPP